MRAALLLGLVACGGAPAPHPASSGAPAARSGETAACRADRLAILDAAERSREQTCATAADCSKVTNPGHPDPEVYLVVHATDAAALKARSADHLARCGAFMHREAIDAFVVVEAKCTAERCVAAETTYHVD